MIKTRNLLLLVSVLLLVLCLAACGGEAKADSIRFDKVPRVVYVQGQELDLESAVIMAVTGGNTAQISAADVTVSGYNKDTLGKQTVTITYGGASTTLDVTVIPRIEVEGAVKDYFVGDVFDQSKGRLRIANDLGVVTGVALNDAGVSVSGFDSSKAGSNVAVTISYGGYTGTVNVNVYDVAKVELSSSPTKTQYGSHETVFDVTGAFFTVSAAGVNFERYVELTADMVKGFDPSVATIENIDQALKQKVTISYLGYDFEMEISVKFSGVSLMQLRAKELASVDINNIPEAKGELALEAMRAYLKLDNAAKEAVSEADKNTVARIAVIYGYAQFLEAKDVFSDAVTLSAVEQEGGETIGMFKIVAESYTAAERALVGLTNKDNEMIALGELLQSIKGRFGTLEIKDEKTTKEYLELLYTAEGLSAAVEILEIMTELYEQLSVVGTEWKAEDLEAYKSNIKTAVVIITGSEFNPFKAPPYNEIFTMLSKWREKDDYFDIIYAYYMKYEQSGVIDSLWQNVPMPEKLQNIYVMLVNAANKTANINVGGDLTQFYYYFKEALRNADAVLNGNNKLHKDIYNKFNLGNLIKSYMFVGNNMNNIGYVYYVSSMVDNEKFEKILNKYLEIVFNGSDTFDFTDKDVQQSVKELVDMYANLSPAEQFAFISAIYCDYRFTGFSGYLFECTIGDDNSTKATSSFTYLIAQTYREMLSEDAWSVFTRLLTASEAHACRFREEGKKEAFMEMMEDILADAAKLTKEEKETFITLLDKMTLLYNECVTPTAPNAGAHKEKVDQLLSYIDKFFELNYAMSDSDLTAVEKSNIVTLWVAVAEKAKALENEILATGDQDLIYTYLYCIYTFDTDRESEDKDIKSTINYMMDEIRATQINMLVTTNLAHPNNTNSVYNGYSLYYEYGLREFLVKAVDVMYAAFKENADKLDKAFVLETLGMIRQMDKNTMFTFMMFNANAYYYEGVYECLAANCDPAVADMIKTLLSAEEQYVTYMSINSEDNRAQFCSNMETLKEKYDALSDKALFEDLLGMYQYYKLKYDSIKNA